MWNLSIAASLVGLGGASQRGHHVAEVRTCQICLVGCVFLNIVNNVIVEWKIKQYIVDGGVVSTLLRMGRSTTLKKSQLHCITDVATLNSSSYILRWHPRVCHGPVVRTLNFGSAPNPLRAVMVSAQARAGRTYDIKARSPFAVVWTVYTPVLWGVREHHTCRCRDNLCRKRSTSVDRMLATGISCGRIWYELENKASQFNHLWTNSLLRTYFSGDYRTLCRWCTRLWSGWKPSVWEVYGSRRHLIRQSCGYRVLKNNIKDKNQQNINHTIR